jgi:hypothetical protein
MTTMTVDDLTERGINAFKHGDKRGAAELLYQATKADPANQRAWLWLAGTVPTTEGRRICLEHVIAIASDSPLARQAIAGLTELTASPSPPATRLDSDLTHDDASAVVTQAMPTPAQTPLAAASTLPSRHHASVVATPALSLPVTTPTDTLPERASRTPPPRRHRHWLGSILTAALLTLIWSQVGVYTIQPIGFIPDGMTVIFWRHGGEPFFTSADATCLRAQGSVSLLCRVVALGQAPTDQIIMRLPYQQWAYLVSTGGQSFDR